MDSNQYPGNSDRGQQTPAEAVSPSYQERRVKHPVVQGEVRRKEKNSWDGIREFFGIAECNSFRDYVSALSDMTNRVYGAIDTLLGNRRYQNSTVPGARVSYGSYYQNPVVPNSPTQGAAKQPQPGIYGSDGPLFDLRSDAEVVLGNMFGLLTDYQNVSVGDMYDLAGLTSPHGYTDFKYGWRELTNARVVPFGSKWVISLPPAMPLR